MQGVGFRPFIYNLARRYDLTGEVFNDSRGVQITVQGIPASIESFENDIRIKSPPQSRITALETDIIDEQTSYTDFRIDVSAAGGDKSTAISPDLNVCPDCLRELFDPKDRRYLYPFINCTNCGPRYTIIRDIPYDRPKTTMASFQMCSRCQQEYDDPANRRFHAQPNACPVCGPQLSLYSSDRELIGKGGDAQKNRGLFKVLAEHFEAGRIVAIKGIGGFHLACDATNEKAVAALRQRKYRQDKPFAVMFPDLNTIRDFCRINPAEIELLQSVARPIVLLRKSESRDVAYSAAPNNHYLGAMLPYTPLHYLIFRFWKRPLIMTSGNVSDEPIVYRNEELFDRLSSIADYFLVHDRMIHIRCDDSVTRIWESKPYILRRSRGYVPQELTIDRRFRRQVLACGPEQKNTFTLAKDRTVYISQHIGDLENYEVLKALEEGVTHFRSLFDLNPEIIAYDLHPDYLSTKYALDYQDENRDVRKIGIQHHHAHAVSCMIENGLNHPVIALVLDGTGYGEDGTIWGGEFLIAEYNRYHRMGHLKTVAMPGAGAAIKNPWQMAVAFLYQVFADDLLEFEIPLLKAIPKESVQLILQLINSQQSLPITSSCGRLFDAVAALCGLRYKVNYEGQAAVEFEQSIQKISDDSYDFYTSAEDSGIILNWDRMLKQVVADIEQRIPIGEIAVRFHNGLAGGLLKVAVAIRNQTDINDVVLSGGVFMNIYLLSRLKKLLENKGFYVYTHSVVPCNDGGISLGQAVIADGIDQRQQ